ncbi:hypothetical protein Tco_1289853 [Tanacetum coccineum]
MIRASHEMLALQVSMIKASCDTLRHPLSMIRAFVSLISVSGFRVQMAQARAHVVMAVRNTKASHELIRKWQDEWPRVGLPLNIEVMELDLLSLNSVVKFPRHGMNAYEIYMC